MDDAVKNIQENKKPFFLKLIKEKRFLIALIIIVSLAAILRLSFLSQHDMIDDEAIISLRSVGYFDYFNSGSQFSPVQLLPEKQWWQDLSFHDGPPLTFFVQHVFFKAFGDSPFTARLPVALVGIFSVLAMYFLGTALYDKNFGLIAATILAVSNYHVYISRVVFYESFMLLFIILTLLFLFKSLENSRYLLLTFFCLGLALLSKYTAIVLIPVIFLFLLIVNRKVFFDKNLYIGLAIFIITILPVVIYNVMMYKSLGHFDSPLSAMLGMQVEDYWGVGYESGGNYDIRKIYTSLTFGFNPLLLLVSAAGLFLTIKKIIIYKNPLSYKSEVILILYFIFTVLMMLQIHPLRKQHVAVIIPAIVIMASLAMYKILANKKYFYIVGVIVFIYMIVVTINSQLLVSPIGKQYLTYTPLQPVHSGYKYLDDYLEEFFKTQSMLGVGTIKQIEAYQTSLFTDKMAAEREEAFILNPEKAVVYYDERMDYMAVRWLFLRRALYELRPITITKDFISAYEENPEFSDVFGFDVSYFIFASTELLNRQGLDTEALDGPIETLEKDIVSAGNFPIKEIADNNGEVLFKVYKVKPVDFEAIF